MIIQAGLSQLKNQRKCHSLGIKPGKIVAFVRLKVSKSQINFLRKEFEPCVILHYIIEHTALYFLVYVVLSDFD